MKSKEVDNTHSGRVLPYLGMVGRFRGDDPVLGIFNPIGSLFYTSTTIPLTPLSSEKLVYFKHFV